MVWKLYNMIFPTTLKLIITRLSDLECKTIAGVNIFADKEGADMLLSNDSAFWIGMPDCTGYYSKFTYRGFIDECICPLTNENSI